ncbi:MAG TPA: hypothetical protein PLH19_00865 [Anaerolineae bacterium]|nr:hypothetical protein [Anaerolineae bacterium]HQH37071.1 hypothetical protein [Anaerolineae bacterium]
MNTQLSPVEIDQEQARRVQMARAVIRASMAGAAIFLVVFVSMVIVAPNFESRYGGVAALVFLVFSGISLGLIRRQRLSLAITIYLTALIASLTVAVYLLGGVTGPMAMGFVMAVVIVGLIGEPKSLRYASIIVGVIYLTLAILEATQVLHPAPVPEVARWWIEIVFFLAIFVVTALAVGAFVNQTGRAFAAERQRSLELVQATRQAEQLAIAERESHEWESRAAVHLRETVAGYVDYLSRVAAGDYTARVDVGVLDEAVEGDRELHALGEYLNTTVDALVAALTQAQETQRRYTEQAWETFVESGRVQPGFAYRQNQITPEVEWLPQMAQAVDSGTPVVEDKGAAVPLVINRQVVGALGGEHPDGRPWTAEELALIEDITGQLAQTIESLRLFDDVQRRAAREQISAQVTARMRESLDMETVLRTAVAEMRRSLGLDKIAIHLGVSQK